MRQQTGERYVQTRRWTVRQNGCEIGKYLARKEGRHDVGGKWERLGE